MGLLSERLWEVSSGNPLYSFVFHVFLKFLVSQGGRGQNLRIHNPSRPPFFRKYPFFFVGRACGARVCANSLVSGKIGRKTTDPPSAPPGGLGGDAAILKKQNFFSCRGPGGPGVLGLLSERLWGVSPGYPLYFLCFHVFHEKPRILQILGFSGPARRRGARPPPPLVFSGDTCQTLSCELMFGSLG